MVEDKVVGEILLSMPLRPIC